MRNLKSFFTRKLGPLPVGVWVLVLVGGILVARYLRAQKASASTTSSADTTGQDFSYDPGTTLSGTDPGATGVLGDASQADVSGLQDDVSLLYDLYGTLANEAFTGGDTSSPAASPASTGEPSTAVTATPTAPAPAVTPTDPTPGPTSDAPLTQTLTETSSGVKIGTVTVPTYPLSTPASVIYAAAGLSPSDPVTLLPSSNLPPSPALAPGEAPTPGSSLQRQAA